MAVSEALVVEGEMDGRTGWTGTDVKGGRDDTVDKAMLSRRMITDRHFRRVCYLISGTVEPLCYSIKVVEMGWINPVWIKGVVRPTRL